MDVTAAPRPHSSPRNSATARPTQAYYVPRRLLECGRGPLPTAEGNADRTQQTVLRPQPPVSKPRPLMAELLPPPASLKEKQRQPAKNSQNRRSPPASTQSPAAGHKKPQKLNTPRKSQESSKQIYVAPPQSTSPKSSYSSSRSSSSMSQLSPQAPKRATTTTTQTLTTSVPRVIAPKGPQKYTLSRPNQFCTVVSPSDPKDGCICDRAKTHVLCKRCGYEGFGRVQIVCGAHPLMLALNDLRECPNPLCRSIQLVEAADAAIDTDGLDLAVEKIDLSHV
ncbi:unnamed protein product [Caenorhabditis auriculariae]|uniref:Uncharacterized protein n=1 Tax=Caenorhabditis auriculariae TaxID=2777116 RepID=A0A8S1HCE0_9PELO|nr:unnamed protein product [Caenorhabditis auriculariae]